MSDVTTVLIGPGEHGVVRYGLTVARAAGTAIARYADVASCRAAPPTDARACHWHFTDRLFGASVEEACAAFVDTVDRTGGRHVVTLHDVPPPGGTARDRRRARAYRRIGARCDAVVVASRHERRRLAAAGMDRPVTVIPLAVAAPAGEVAATRPPCADAGRHIAVLGFIYPGKGHDAVLSASAGLPGDVAVVALGRASDGHEDLVGQLHRAAAADERRFRATGFLSDAELAAAVAAADVPVVPARDVSASASLAAWLAGGRRPLVAASAYSAELAALDAGLLVEYQPHELPAALRRALDDPASTHRSGPVPPVLRLDAVAAAHRGLFGRVAP